MLKYFKRPPLLNPDSKSKLLLNVKWFLATQHYQKIRQQIRLITPADKLFSTQQSASQINSSPQIKAINLLKKMRDQFHLQAWDCKLANQLHQSTEKHKQNLDQLVFIETIPAESNAALNNDIQTDITVCIQPELINNPLLMVDIYISELAKTFLSLLSTDNQTVASDANYLQDLIAIFLGFGIFRCNAKFQTGSTKYPATLKNTYQSSTGMTQDELTYCLAYFCILNSTPHEEIECFLKLQLHKLFRRALIEIGKSKLIL